MVEKDTGDNYGQKDIKDPKKSPKSYVFFRKKQ